MSNSMNSPRPSTVEVQQILAQAFMLLLTQDEIHESPGSPGKVYLSYLYTLDLIQSKVPD